MLAQASNGYTNPLCINMLHLMCINPNEIIIILNPLLKSPLLDYTRRTRNVAVGSNCSGSQKRIFNSGNFIALSKKKTFFRQKDTAFHARRPCHWRIQQTVSKHVPKKIINRTQMVQLNCSVLKKYL